MAEVAAVVDHERVERDANVFHRELKFGLLLKP